MDRKSIGKATILLTAWFSGYATSEDCRACGLFNCFKRNPTPVTSYYPATTTYSPQASTPSCGGNCGAGYCEQTVLRYVPQVAYRTVWQPVPVTTYRRTVSCNPSTGLPITCTQPCTTYTYQVRRVPYTTFRPTYTTEPVTTTAPAATVAPTTIAPANPGCGCNSAPSGWSTATSVQPYYSAPAATASPSYGVPSTPAPGYPATESPAPGYTAPGYASPSSPSPVGGGSAGEATPWEPVTPESSAAPVPGYQSPSGLGSGTSDPASQRPRINPELNSSSSDWPAPPSSNPPTSAVESSITTRGYTSPPTADGKLSPWTTVRPEIQSPPSFPSSNRTSTSPPPASADWSTNSQQPPPYTVRPLPKVESSEPAAPDADVDAPARSTNRVIGRPFGPSPPRPSPFQHAGPRIGLSGQSGPSATPCDWHRRPLWSGYPWRLHADSIQIVCIKSSNDLIPILLRPPPPTPTAGVPLDASRPLFRRLGNDPSCGPRHTTW